ncbi:MAG: Maf family nucleotide pyrophosphatase [Bacteroidota bacterium]
MVFEHLKKYQIILASASPRRQQLLQELGLDFEILVKAVQEDFPLGMPGEEVALLLSNRKAAAFEADFFTDSKLIITADTIVCLEGEVLGKPSSRDDAINTLSNLSGKMHEVITGVSIRSAARQVNFAVATDVYFKQLHKKEIIYYVDHYKPFDKAGAYGIQEWIGYVGVERINGSFYNVMGLPVLKLYEELLKF